MIGTPPAYVPAPGRKALATRLNSLLAADVPVACGVYVGLAEPGAASPRHAEATYARAQHLASETVDVLPHFNTIPPAILRVLGAASWGRADALGNRMREFPADLATELWRRVESRASDPAALSPDERRHAAELMLRLGYVAEAASVLGLSEADPKTHVFELTSGVAELAVLARRRHDSGALEERVLDVARDAEYPASVRTVMATFVVVRNGRRGADTPAMHEAAGLARLAMEALETSDFARHLARQTVYRAIAYLPFLRGDVAATFELLEQALSEQFSAKPKPGSELEELAWIDHAFPVFETIARTHLQLGDAEQAVAATDQLTALSPNDPRSWAMRGRALLAVGRLEEALVAYGRAIPLGGLPVAHAAYHLGWIHEQLGNRDEADSNYRLSWKIDPTVPALAEIIERAGT